MVRPAVFTHDNLRWVPNLLEHAHLGVQHDMGSYIVRLAVFMKNIALQGESQGSNVL